MRLAVLTTVSKTYQAGRMVAVRADALELASWRTRCVLCGTDSVRGAIPYPVNQSRDRTRPRLKYGTRFCNGAAGPAARPSLIFLHGPTADRRCSLGRLAPSGRRGEDGL